MTGPRADSFTPGGRSGPCGGRPSPWSRHWANALGVTWLCQRWPTLALLAEVVQLLVAAQTGFREPQVRKSETPPPRGSEWRVRPVAAVCPEPFAHVV